MSTDEWGERTDKQQMQFVCISIISLHINLEHETHVECTRLMRD